MKSNDIAELRRKTPIELQKLLVELRDELWSKRIDLKRGKVKNIREVHDVRKRIARVSTLLAESPTLLAERS